MRHMKAMLLGAALMAGTTTLAVAQSVVPVQWGWGQRDNDDRQAYREGFRRGQEDARHNRRFDPDEPRKCSVHGNLVQRSRLCPMLYRS